MQGQICNNGHENRRLLVEVFSPISLFFEENIWACCLPLVRAQSLV